MFAVEGINGNMVKPFLKKEHIEIPESAIKTYFEKFVIKQADKLDIHAKGFDIEKDRLTDELYLGVERRFYP